MLNKLSKYLLVLTFVILTLGCVGLLTTTEYAVLNKPIPENQEITVHDVELKRFLTSAGSELATEYKDLVGKIATVELPANTQISTKVLKEKEVITPDMENMVVVPVPVVNEHVPSDIKEGDLVNFVFAYDSVALDDAKMSDKNPFAAGIDTPLTVVNISRTENVITKVDVLVDKAYANDILTAVALSGDNYLVSNKTYNETKLSGMTVQDLYFKYFAKQEAVQQPEQPVEEVAQ